MSTFYVLPPRPLFGDHLAAFLQTFLPGLDWDAAARAGLADAVADCAVSETDAYLVFRDELPDGERLARALTDGYGAEDDDEVVEVHFGGRAGEGVAQRWRIGDRRDAAHRGVTREHSILPHVERWVPSDLRVLWDLPTNRDSADIFLALIGPPDHNQLTSALSSAAVGWARRRAACPRSFAREPSRTMFAARLHREDRIMAPTTPPPLDQIDPVEAWQPWEPTPRTPGTSSGPAISTAGPPSAPAPPSWTRP